MSAVTNVQHTEFVNILCYIKLESSQGVPVVWNIVENKVSLVQLWLKHVRCEKGGTISYQNFKGTPNIY